MTTSREVAFAPSLRLGLPPLQPSVPSNTGRASLKDGIAVEDGTESDGDDDGPGYDTDPQLSQLEAQVLTEWERLRRNLDVLANQLHFLSARPSGVVADGLRVLERQTNLVCTALKSSVYSIVLSAQDEEGGRDEE